MSFLFLQSSTCMLSIGGVEPPAALNRPLHGLIEQRGRRGSPAAAAQHAHLRQQPAVVWSGTPSHTPATAPAFVDIAAHAAASINDVTRDKWNDDVIACDDTRATRREGADRVGAGQHREDRREPVGGEQQETGRP